MTVQIIGQLLLSLLTAGKKLHRAITMRTNALTTPYQRENIGILQYTVEFR